MISMSVDLALSFARCLMVGWHYFLNQQLLRVRYSTSRPGSRLGLGNWCSHKILTDNIEILSSELKRGNCLSQGFAPHNFMHGMNPFRLLQGSRANRLRLCPGTYEVLSSQSIASLFVPRWSYAWARILDSCHIWHLIVESRKRKRKPQWGMPWIHR